MEKLRVLLADDHSVVREGLKYILKKYDHCQVVGEADTGIAVVELAEQLQPDIVIMDLKMPILNGFEASRRIMQSNPNIKIFTLSSNITTMTFQQAHAAGILGFVDKESVFTELYKAIEAVSQGSPYYCSRVRSVMGSGFRDMVLGNQQKNQLTANDRNLVQMLADGKSVGEIGLFLNKSPKTIDARRRKIMNQLGLSSLAELTKYAISEGITTAELYN